MAKNNVESLFAQIRTRLTRKLNDLPRIIGNEIINHSLDSFAKQEWEGDPWQKRKTGKETGRAVLIKSGALRRSIRVISTTHNSVVVGSSLPYARVHNEGLTINRAERQETFIRARYQRGKKGAFRKMTAKEKNSAPTKGLKFKAYSIKMPQRRFLGNSPALRAHIRKVVIAEINSALKK